MPFIWQGCPPVGACDNSWNPVAAILSDAGLQQESNPR